MLITFFQKCLIFLSLVFLSGNFSPCKNISFHGYFKIIDSVFTCSKNFNSRDTFASDQKLYFSSSANKNLPYFILYPKNRPTGILIYMHGAGGGMEQGMSAQLYKGNFNKLKDLVMSKFNYIYITPSTTNFEQEGGQNLNELALQIHEQYPKLPIYLAGASAGGRTVSYAIQNKLDIFSGVILLCPALSEDLITQGNIIQDSLPFWIVQGDKDQAVSPQMTDQFVLKLKQNKNVVNYKKISGDHNAPVEEVDWEQALKFLED